MPIAYKRPMDLGYGKVVLILTRDLTYRKKPMSPMMERAYRHYFAPLPHLLDSLMEIPDRYNRMVEEIVRLESEGKIFVIRPEHPVTVSRMEQSIPKLEALYAEGRRVAEERLHALRNYLEE